MTQAEATDPLDQEIFTYRVNKDGKVFVFWHGKAAVTLKGKAAQQFVAQVALADARSAQLLMAKVTGNFKHGNERLAKKANKHR